MNHTSLVGMDRIVKVIYKLRYSFAVLKKSGIVEMPQDEVDKHAGSERTRYRNSTPLILPECQMRLWICHGYNNVRTAVKIKSNWKWNKIPRNHIGIQCVFNIDIWVVLKLF